MTLSCSFLQSLMKKNGEQNTITKLCNCRPSVPSADLRFGKSKRINRTQPRAAFTNFAKLTDDKSPVTCGAKIAKDFHTFKSKLCLCYLHGSDYGSIKLQIKKNEKASKNTLPRSRDENKGQGRRGQSVPYISQALFEIGLLN